jgi:hypothetical protein
LNTLISGNVIEDDSGICLGALSPDSDLLLWTDLDGSTVCCNTVPL